MALLNQTRSVRKAKTNNLFFAGLIRWQALTAGERFVCINIILVPIWWAAGIYKFLPFLLLSSIVLYEWLRSGDLYLKRPNLPVVALFTFGAYRVGQILAHYNEPGRGSISTVFFSWFCLACLLWYIQSKDIRIRLEVVAWACTVSAAQMIVFWLLLQFVLPQSLFIPPHLPTFFALVKSQAAEDSSGNFFLLAPYEINNANVGGLYRLSLFFISAQFFGVVAGFIGFVALEIKNRFWSLLLLFTCVLLIVLSTSRSVWVAFPLVVGLRYLYSTLGERWGPPVIFALMAVTSFTTLSFPPITDLVVNQFTGTARAIDQFRAGSTDQRLEIYKQTWQAIQENLLWGHATKGTTLIDPHGPSHNLVGSHSVILGDLLYINGLVGTTIFAVFWISLFVWLYKTRSGRPLISFCVWGLYTLVSPTMAALMDISLSPLIILLCAAIGCPKGNPTTNKTLFKRSRYA